MCELGAALKCGAGCLKVEHVSFPEPTAFHATQEGAGSDVPGSRVLTRLQCVEAGGDGPRVCQGHLLKLVAESPGIRVVNLVRPRVESDDQAQVAAVSLRIEFFFR